MTVCRQIYSLSIQTTTKVNSAFHPSRMVNQVQVCLAGIKVGRIHLGQVATWQVTLCDSIADDALLFRNGFMGLSEQLYTTTLL